MVGWDGEVVGGGSNSRVSGGRRVLGTRKWFWVEVAFDVISQIKGWMGMEYNRCITYRI